jgi:hypothetical protein
VNAIHPSFTLTLIRSCEVSLDYTRLAHVKHKVQLNLDTSRNLSSYEQGRDPVMVLQLGPQCSGRPTRTLSTSSRSSSSCHGSKGLWLEVSFVCCYLFRTSTKHWFTSRGEDAQDKRSRLAWIGDEVETEALNAM